MEFHTGDDQTVPVTVTLAQQNSRVPMKLWKLEEPLEACRYVTELLGGQQYISSSVVLSLCHLFRVLEPSDDDPVYIMRLKKKSIKQRPYLVEVKRKFCIAQDCCCFRCQIQAFKVTPQP